MFVKRIIIILVSISCINEVISDNLVASVVVFRHGERTPRHFHPNDPYQNNSYWPVPFGELTSNGIIQAYELGKWVRQRYKDTLPKRYQSKDFFIYSSGLDRTLMSASAFASGLYPSVLQNTLPFQPIPIHSKPRNLDNTIHVGDKPCPKQKQLLNNLFNTNFFKKLDEDHAQLYRYMSTYMGMDITTFFGLEDYYDTWFIEELNNFTLSDWAKEIYPNQLQKIAHLNLLVPTYTTELARFKIGSMYSEILSYFTSFTNDTDEFESDFNMGLKGRKLLAVSGHDVNIAAILNTLKVPKISWPPYSSGVVFELKRRRNSQLYVNVFFKNSTEVIRLNIEGCGFNCALSSFVNYLRPITMSPKKWDENCIL